jgi:transposase
MTGIRIPVEVDEVIVGVDTHKDVHVAVAVDGLGRRLAEVSVETNGEGLARLHRWAELLAGKRVWAVEGTGSYGAGLARYLHAAGETVREVSRPDRRLRRDRGKSDPIDAEAAARAVLAEQTLGIPKAGDGPAEALRQLRATRRAAVKARTQAANLLHALILTAPEDLRAELTGGTLKDKIRRCARLRPGPAGPAREACKLSLRSTARRWQHLTDEITDLDQAVAAITAQAAPQLLDQFGVGPDVAAALLVAAGGNPTRLRREASFAALCGVNPLPASSGKTRRHRLNRGGDRQANAALHTVALARMRSDPRTRSYVERRTRQGMTRREIMRCIKRYLARDLYPLILLSQPGRRT